MYQYRFGSWNDAVRKAGLTPRRNEYTNKELIDILQKLAKKLGHTPRRVDINEDCPNLDTYERHFGSYEKAIKKAGLKPIPSHLRITEEELIKKLKDLARVLKHTPSMREMAKTKNYPDPSTYQDRFGSWKKALKKAGLEKSLKLISDKKLIRDLKRLAKELAHTPTYWEMAGLENYPHPRTYSDRFGSWGKAIKKAGLTPVKKGYSDEELFRYMVRLKNKLGRMPYHQEMLDAEGYPAPTTYANHFGSWEKAKLAFQEWKKGKNIVELCRECELDYFKLRDFTMTLVDKGQLDCYMMQMSDEEVIPYLEFIKDNFYAICERMKITRVSKNISLKWERRKNIYGDRIDVYTLRIKND